jgi:hypothetical protein
MTPPSDTRDMDRPSPKVGPEPVPVQGSPGVAEREDDGLILDSADLPAFSYTSYHEIAEAMSLEHIHPEAAEKLDAIVRAFGG